MKSSKSMVEFTALTAAVCAVPAPSVAATIKPGPVRVVFAASTDDGPRADDTSQLFYGLSNFITLTGNGPIIWKGHVSAAGQLSFPLVKQSRPDNTILS